MTSSRMSPTRSRRLGAAILAMALGISLLGPPAGAATDPSIPARSTPGQTAPLTNLAHLNFLSAGIAVSESSAHSTYRLAVEPTVGVVWVYADARPGGQFARVGGGAYDAVANTWGQGAFDADDIARAAVVYLRSWSATGDDSAKRSAYQQLRGLAYLQTLTGPKAGEVVLWMQPDGSLTPSAIPPELPDPSDSGPSYWLARTLWALGEGYAAFQHSDPDFAAFLKVRMDLAIVALNRDVLGSYRTSQLIHGVRLPNWLIVNGADASSEAVLGLAAYVGASGDRTARTALRQLSAGIGKMSAGSTTGWPYRAILPWVLSRSDWHAWGSNMPAALAAAGRTLHDNSLLSTAVDDTAGFTAQLLTSTGPVNGLLPSPTDLTQIAYGADARVQGLLAVGAVTGRPGIRRLAGIAAGWFFGQNASGHQVYDPATGVTLDGVQADGSVNPNSGAESTIHGLLTMLALDANPDLAELAQASAVIRVRDGLQVVEAETGVLTGGAAVVTPASTWTGESQWSGSYVSVAPGSSVNWILPVSDQPLLVQPVVELIPGSRAVGVVSSGRSRLGVVNFGAVGQQGNAPSPTKLIPIDLHGTLGSGDTELNFQMRGGTGNIDALLVMPEVATLVIDGDNRFTALLTSKSSSVERRSVPLGGSGLAQVTSYDRMGRQTGRQLTSSTSPQVEVMPGGFTILTR